MMNKNSIIRFIIKELESTLMTDITSKLPVCVVIYEKDGAPNDYTLVIFTRSAIPFMERFREVWNYFFLVFSQMKLIRRIKDADLLEFLTYFSRVGSKESYVVPTFVELLFEMLLSEIEPFASQENPDIIQVEPNFSLQRNEIFEKIKSPLDLVAVLVFFILNRFVLSGFLDLLSERTASMRRAKDLAMEIINSVVANLPTVDGFAEAFSPEERLSMKKFLEKFDRYILLDEDMVKDFIVETLTVKCYGDLSRDILTEISLNLCSIHTCNHFSQRIMPVEKRVFCGLMKLSRIIWWVRKIGRDKIIIKTLEEIIRPYYRITGFPDFKSVAKLIKIWKLYNFSLSTIENIWKFRKDSLAKRVGDFLAEVIDFCINTDDFELVNALLRLFDFWVNKIFFSQDRARIAALCSYLEIILKAFNKYGIEKSITYMFALSIHL